MGRPYLESFLYLFINKMPPIYMLKLDKSPLPCKTQLSFYAQGMSAQCIAFTNVTHWSILRMILIGGKPIYFNLTRHFIAFQRLIKLYAQFLRSVRSLRVLRLREETGRGPRWRMPLKGELYAEARTPPIGALYDSG